MEQARITAECKQLVEDLKPGSGKIWKNKLTKPKTPNLTGIINSMPKERLVSDFNENAYEPMIIQQNRQSLTRNISIGEIKSL